MILTAFMDVDFVACYPLLKEISLHMSESKWMYFKSNGRHCH